MLDVIFIVEDKNDVFFLRDLILKNYCDSDTKKAKKINEKICEIGINDKKILIRDTDENEGKTGGWTKLKGLLNSTTINKLLSENEKVKIVTIFDADEDKSDNIKVKEDIILKWVAEININVERFYLPYNNNESHNLEQLLELSFNKPFDSCWTDLVNCMAMNKTVEPMSKKGKIIVYKDFYGVRANDGYLSDKWNLDFKSNGYLQQLKSFLDTYLQ